jgi:hypothetical protein
MAAANTNQEQKDKQDPSYNVFRDSALRYAGYANEVGESFRYQVRPVQFSVQFSVQFRAFVVVIIIIIIVVVVVIVPTTALSHISL